MLQLNPQLLRPRMPQSKNTTAVMVIGGAEDKIHGRQILQTFFQRSGGTNAKIAIIPCASREPAAIGSRYHEIFEEMGAKAIEVIDIRDRDNAANPSWQAYVEDCTGVFMTGGDQLRLCELLSDTLIMERVRMRAQLGEITLAGTSAGAAVMGQQMIAGGGSGESPNHSLVDMTIGLGIIPEVLVDQHFHNRNRMGRLLSAVAAHTDKLGIGIDEDTCAMFEQDGVFQVIGKGAVTVVDPGQVSHTNYAHVTDTEPISIHNLRLHILTHGDRFDIYKRQVVSSGR
ncbi:cyanophycinase [Leptolyngbya sp. FACHB-711]|uniref:cyanophycinase n=1 Tax=unclassified Leptolyngbya TaxID=2650499 RepID=UPI001682CB55|nr:cyanophycinase [Cyanobacteria bacterium FACHB-502]MBD2027738.1 cyanophycinase [Leptolyngbya sp. FACHB-711]